MNILNMDFEIGKNAKHCPYSSNDFIEKREEILDYARSHGYQTLTVDNACDLLGISFSEFQDIQRTHPIFLTEEQIRIRKEMGWGPMGLANNEPARGNDLMTFDSFIQGYEALLVAKKALEQAQSENARNVHRRAVMQYQMDRQRENQLFNGLLETLLRHFLEANALSYGIKFGGCTFTRPNGEILKIKAIDPGKTRYAYGDPAPTLD